MTKYCTNCGSENSDNAHFCLKCGAQLRNNETKNDIVKENTENNNQNNSDKQNNENNNPNLNQTYYTDEKSPGVAALLSFLIIGAGFLYIEDTRQFAIYFIIGLVLGILSIVTMGLLLIAYIPFLIYQIYDSYQKTIDYNNKKHQLYQNLNNI